MNTQIAIEEASQVGHARREAVALARRLSIDAGAADRLALTVTEVATNLLKHGGGGELLLSPLARDQRVGIEVLALDRGPGMGNVATSLRDGHSTAGSLGIGLGSITRLASHLDVYSRSDAGTVLRFEVWATDAPPVASYGGVCIAKAGEATSGDAWLVQSSRDSLRLLVVDGVGHGPEAASAAHAALRVAQENPALPPDRLLDVLHAALHGTRGAAAAVALVRTPPSSALFAGIGNISCVVHAERPRSLVSHNGTLGHQVRRIQPFDFDFPMHALLIMHSDGVSARWSLDAYPGIARHHPAIIAATLYRDHARGRDDATVVVLRCGSNASQ